VSNPPIPLQGDEHANHRDPSIAPSGVLASDSIISADPLSDSEAREVAKIVESLGDHTTSRSDKAKQLVKLSGIVGRQARRAGATAVGSGKFLADLLLDAAPHIPIRELDLLVAHYNGLTGEALADAVIRNAKRATMGVGAAGGAVAAAEWGAMPMLLAIPIELVVETLVVAAIEVKLVAELHAVYAVPVEGSGTQRAMAFTGSWAHRRGVDPLRPWAIPSVLGIAGRQALGKRMIGRFARNLGTMVPFLIGAVVGARINGSETERLASALRDDLRRIGALSRNSPPWA